MTFIKPTPPFRAVLFDLDGTLLNTNNLIIQSFQYVFQKIDGRSISPEKVIECFGEPLSTSLKRLSPSNWEAMLDEYRRYSLLHHDELTEMFYGARDCLVALRREGLKLAVVTSKLRGTAIKGLDLFDLTKLFDGIIGMEDCQQHKPDPEPVQRGCQLLDVAPEHAMMVGDSAFDILSAKAAGVYAVGVAWTMNQPEALIEAGADAMISSFDEILHIAVARKGIG